MYTNPCTILRKGRIKVFFYKYHALASFSTLACLNEPLSVEIPRTPHPNKAYQEQASSTHTINKTTACLLVIISYLITGQRFISFNFYIIVRPIRLRSTICSVCTVAGSMCHPFLEEKCINSNYCKYIQLLLEINISLINSIDSSSTHT